jgi:hypothetical protein
VAEISRTCNRITLSSLLLLSPLLWAACSTADGKTKDREPAALAIAVSPVAATDQPIARFIRVTGTLTAEEQADVAAETAGRLDAGRARDEGQPGGRTDPVVIHGDGREREGSRSERRADRGAPRADQQRQF